MDKQDKNISFSPEQLDVLSKLNGEQIATLATFSQKQLSAIGEAYKICQTRHLRQTH